MKIGIFADIHGNIYAFKNIWRSLKRESCDLYCFVGDICGYYYYQNEVIEILKGIKNLICVSGNHDDLFLKVLKENKRLEMRYRQRYGKSCDILKKRIKPENLTFLKKLPKKYILDEYNLAIFHGSPWNHLDGYIYPTDSLRRFRRLPYRFILMGHTHRPMYKEVDNICVINPGSCGQPRDYNCPSYAVLDYESKRVKFKRVSYNRNSLIKDVKRYSEKNRYLIEVLKREKYGR